jgi:hemerythrin
MAADTKFLSQMHNLLDMFSAQKKSGNRTIISWRNRYSVNVEDIDNQHKAIFDLINKYYNHILEGSSNKETGYVLDELIHSLTEHFSFEEELMRLYAYPGLYSHKHLHDYFISELNRMKTDLEKYFGPVSLNSGNFIRKWIVNHILRSDKSYSTFLRLRGIS